MSRGSGAGLRRLETPLHGGKRMESSSKRGRARLRGQRERSRGSAPRWKLRLQHPAAGVGVRGGAGFPRVARAQVPALPRVGVPTAWAHSRRPRRILGRNNRVHTGKALGPFPPAARQPPAGTSEQLQHTGRRRGAGFPGRRGRNRCPRARASLPPASHRPFSP